VDQVDRTDHFLFIAGDCFLFVINFFEVINISATHIYHSALELCPMSSTIRRLYHHRSITRSPKVVIGTPESWPQTIGISGKDRYNGLCTWSPCGRFVAAQTGKAVEIRNQLTLELVTTLQRTETIPHLTGPLAYSPDGRSIACASDTAIIIWDIQTGGMAKEIKRGTKNISLVWSPDGRTICTVNLKDQTTFIVHTYDVSSNTTSSPGTLQSGDNPYLWTDDKSVCVMRTVRRKDITIDIFEIGSILVKIQSFTFVCSELSEAKIRSFSPTTRHISISDDRTLRIFDIQNSDRLLDKTGHFLSHSFSSDGRRFAASQESGVHIWKYGFEGYFLWGEFQCRGLSNSPLQFSPTPSSILGHSGDILQVWRLDECPKSHHPQDMRFSCSGARIATAHELGSTVTIFDLLEQTPPQTIDTNVEIEGLALTDNVLLVAGSRRLVAWLLTEEGVVNGVIGNRGAGHSNSIWTISQSWSCRREPWLFFVEGQVGVINPDGNALHVYHTGTGEVFHPTQAPSNFSGRWYRLINAHYSQDYACYHSPSQRDTPPGDSWQTSRATLRKGWVKDPKGKHRLWVPVEWRADWDPADWHQDVTTQVSYLGGRAVVIKF